MVAPMADDQMNELFRTLGRLESTVEETKAQNVDIKETLRLAAELAETNKNLAIAAREAKEAREEARFKALDGKLTETHGIATTGAKWIEEKGEPLVTWHHEEGSRLGGRVSILEQAKVAEAAEKIRTDKVQAEQRGEKRGSWKAWSLIGGLIVAAVTLLFESADKIIDVLKGFFAHQGGEISSGKAKAAAGGALMLAFGLWAVVEGWGPSDGHGKYKSYVDVKGIVTACNGHTGPDVRLGQTYTKDECDGLSEEDLLAAFAVEDRYIPNVENVPVSVRGGLAVFIGNVGSGNFAKSSVLTLVNRANAVDPSPWSLYLRACDAMLLYDGYWTGAGSTRRFVVSQGIINRRVKENHLCRGERW